MAGITRITVRELANKAYKEIDESLILLWDFGIEDVLDPSDSVTGSNIKIAYRALGIPTRREFTSQDFWQSMLKLSKEEFSQLLNDLNISVANGSKSLPRNSVKKLKDEAKRRNIPQVKVLTNPPALKKCPPITQFEWKQIGKNRELHHISYDEIILIHEALVIDFEHHNDPISPPGVKDVNLLNSAVFRPLTSIGDDLKCPTVEMASSALLYGIIHDHPFHNGNKRTGLVSMLGFLDANGLMLTCSENLLFKFVLQVAQHRIVRCDTNNLIDREGLEIARWISENSREVEKGERPLPFRKLRSILSGFGCVMDRASNGSKINIQREIKRKGFFRRSKTEILKTQVFYHSEGKDVSKSTINKIRADLNLDENNGIDSIAFYEKSNEQVDDIIVTYAKTLKRLSRL